MSDPFRRCYRDSKGIARIEDQVNLGGQQGTVTYVYASDYDALKAELDEAKRGREKAVRLLNEEREMARRRQYPEPFKISSVYVKRDGLTYLLPIVAQWHEYPDIAIEVGWSLAFVSPTEQQTSQRTEGKP